MQYLQVLLEKIADVKREVESENQYFINEVKKSDLKTLDVLHTRFWRRAKVVMLAHQASVSADLAARETQTEAEISRFSRRITSGVNGRIKDTLSDPSIEAPFVTLVEELATQGCDEIEGYAAALRRRDARNRETTMLEASSSRRLEKLLVSIVARYESQSDAKIKTMLEETAKRDSACFYAFEETSRTEFRWNQSERWLTLKLSQLEWGKSRSITTKRMVFSQALEAKVLADKKFLDDISALQTE